MEQIESLFLELRLPRDIAGYFQKNPNQGRHEPPAKTYITFLKAVGVVLELWFLKKSMQARVPATEPAAEQKPDTGSVNSMASTTELGNGYKRAYHIVPDTSDPKDTAFNPPASVYISYLQRLFSIRPVE